MRRHEMEGDDQVLRLARFACEVEKALNVEYSRVKSEHSSEALIEISKLQIPR